jgi:hypothetical protein
MEWPEGIEQLLYQQMDKEACAMGFPGFYFI